MSLKSEAIRQQWHQAKLAPLWESQNAHKEQDNKVPTHIWRWQEMRPLIEYAFQETSPATSCLANVKPALGFAGR